MILHLQLYFSKDTELYGELRKSPNISCFAVKSLLDFIPNGQPWSKWSKGNALSVTWMECPKKFQLHGSFIQSPTLIRILYLLLRYISPPPTPLSNLIYESIFGSLWKWLIGWEKCEALLPQLVCLLTTSQSCFQTSLLSHFFNSVFFGGFIKTN